MKLILAFLLCLNGTLTEMISSMVERLERQLAFLVEQTEKARQEDTSSKLIMPRSVEKDGKLRMVNRDDWCSGFYPGMLWQMYRLTGKEEWKALAQRNTQLLEEVRHHSGSHDIGFMIYCSYGNGYELTKESFCKDVILEAAGTLATRYDGNVGCIRSWSWGGNRWKFPVIIDNMMNLELLFQASLLGGDKDFYKIALEHADRTLENHFRKDNSTYHVVDYDPEDGSVRRKMTFQGHHDESVWSRGHAWALYGFTMTYRFTRDKRFLRKARGVADFFFGQKDLPEDMVPYWDMRDPDIKVSPDMVPRDASAAAIMASALYELAGYCPGKSASRYRKYADKILTSLCQSYMNEQGTCQGFLLNHSTGNYPNHDEIDVPINYADYYFLEALARYRAIIKE